MLFRDRNGREKNRSRPRRSTRDRLPHAYLWDPEAVRVQESLTKHRPTWPFWTAAGLVVAVAATLIITADRPPIELMEQSRREISVAADGEASEYAPEYLKAARDSLNAASAEFDHQITRLMPFRHYDRVRSASLDAGRIARESMSVVEARRDSTKGVAVVRLSEAEKALAETVRSTRAVEMNGYSRSRLTALDLVYTQGCKLLKSGKYRAALHKAEEIIVQTGKIQQVVDDQLYDYQQNRRLWADWAGETVRWSRQTGGVAILVRKLDRRCDVYRAGRLHHSYPAELGLRWMGYKLRRGDNATPEGRYHVTKKNTASRYYKALEINYPNDEDQRRFNRARQNGWIPKNAAIGGLIMIHGSGGRGTDWTAGCVALANRDLDEVFRVAEVGTPVTIVGAWDQDEGTLGASR